MFQHSFCCLMSCKFVWGLVDPLHVWSRHIANKPTRQSVLCVALFGRVWACAENKKTYEMEERSSTPFNNQEPFNINFFGVYSTHIRQNHSIMKFANSIHRRNEITVNKVNSSAHTNEANASEWGNPFEQAREAPRPALFIQLKWSIELSKHSLHLFCLLFDRSPGWIDHGSSWARAIQEYKRVTCMIAFRDFDVMCAQAQRFSLVALSSIIFRGRDQNISGIDWVELSHSS
jgi:hypothetical protein